ncbi:hypothetical protein ACFQJC_14460 [Haloferax namakaokahaiae]|uniref:Uncharacterized protein n=1 Tax=Haloferax namakaokahaiae TaxID=1748331 RepID=A0ABD5ZHP9_9EURY
MSATEPDANDVPFNEPVTVTIPAGSKATITVRTAADGVFNVDMLAISKRPNTTYTAEFDGVERFDAAIPPTDIDDSSVTWKPPHKFSKRMKVVIRNFGSTSEIYHCQPRGWESVQ